MIVRAKRMPSNLSLKFLTHWLTPLINIRAKELKRCPLTSHYIEGKPSLAHSQHKSEGLRDALTLLIKLRESPHWLTPHIKVRA
jgi:hypothetical protein